MYSEITYLGHVINRQGIHPPDMHRALDRFLAVRMRNKKQVSALLGFVQYWSKFIERLAARTYHIRQLLRKETPFVWTSQCEDERIDVLKALRHPHPLSAIDVNQPIFLFLDASAYGIGCSVTQATSPIKNDEDIDKQIRFARTGVTALRPRHLGL
jgi:hypothetical protein